MSDNLLYEISTMAETTTEPFVKKEVVYVSDQQNGSYNGQISWETSALSNSGKWASWSEAWLEIPYVVSWIESADSHGHLNPANVSLKNSFTNLIDSIQVDYNNTNVVQLTSYSNIWMNFKILTTWSQDDVKKYGATLNFFPDTATSFHYSAAVSAYGNGVSNNNIYPLTAFDVTDLALPLGSYNEGLLKRIRNLGYDIYTGCMGGCSAFYTTPSTTGMNYFSADISGGNDQNKFCYLKIMATIPLKFVHDFFDKIPLVKGSLLKITLNYNSSSQTLAVVNHTSLGFTAGSVTISTGRTNPILIASCAADEPNYELATGNLTVYSGVTKTTQVTHDLTQCRIYCPLYTMNPTFEDQYLSLHPTKEVVYRDIYNFNIIKKSAGGEITTLLTNAITNPKSVLLVPILNGSTAGNNATVTGVNALQSPFASEPATTSPLLAISEFNISVSGINCFPANFKYDYEAWLNELSKTGVNGGLTAGLASGLLSQNDFQTGYRFYYVDLSRRLPLDDSVAKSIQVLGTNASTKEVDYYCFVEYQRSITIAMDTGAIVPM